MKPLLLLLTLLVAPAAFGDEVDAVVTGLESARQTFFADVDDARAEVIATIDSELKRAQREGDLESFDTLTVHKHAFVKQGIIPPSVNTRAFECKLATGLRPLKKAFDAGIRTYVQQGKIEDAKRLREELKAFEDSPLNRSNWGVAEYTIASGASDLKPFVNRARAFTNRGYVWGDISTAWPLKRFAAVAGGKSVPIRISVTSPGWAFIAISNEEPQKVRDYVAKHSWQSTAYAFSYNARGKTPMVIYRKQLVKGDHVLPRVNFAGPILLSP